MLWLRHIIRGYIINLFVETFERLDFLLIVANFFSQFYENGQFFKIDSARLEIEFIFFQNYGTEIYDKI